MKISILTLFPQMFSGPFDYSILKRAQKKNKIDITIRDIRDFGIGNHKLVDDTPYGGGVGMVLRVDVIDKALKATRLSTKKKSYKELVILTDARGEVYSQEKALELSLYDHLIFIAGHYEGVDERVIKLVDISISIGEYVLTGGELPIMVMVDSVIRLIPGVLEKKEAVIVESFSEVGVLEYPQYTKPQTYNNLNVPDILLSGNHKKIQEWRRKHMSRKPNF